MINRIPCKCLLISSLSGLTRKRGMARASLAIPTRFLVAPDKLDIKRQKHGILYVATWWTGTEILQSIWARKHVWKYTYTYRNLKTSHVMRLWFFSSSINSFFNRASAAIHTYSGGRCLMFSRTRRLLPYFMCAKSESSGEPARMRRLAWAFACPHCIKYHDLMSWPKQWYACIVTYLGSVEALAGCWSWFFPMILMEAQI